MNEGDGCQAPMAPPSFVEWPLGRGGTLVHVLTAARKGLGTTPGPCRAGPGPARAGIGLCRIRRALARSLGARESGPARRGCSRGRPRPRTPSGPGPAPGPVPPRSEEHTSELQSHSDLVCRLLLEKKKEQCRRYVVGEDTTQL